MRIGNELRPITLIARRHPDRHVGFELCQLDPCLPSVDADLANSCAAIGAAGELQLVVGGAVGKLGRGQLRMIQYHERNDQLSVVKIRPGVGSDCEMRQSGQRLARPIRRIADGHVIGGHLKYAPGDNVQVGDRDRSPQSYAGLGRNQRDHQVAAPDDDKSDDCEERAAEW